MPDLGPTELESVKVELEFMLVSNFVLLSSSSLAPREKRRRRKKREFKRPL